MAKRTQQMPDHPSGWKTERDRDAERKRETRAAGKEITIPPCEDPKRRKRKEVNDATWLRYYFPELFWYPFTVQQREMIGAIRNAIRFGGDQALAASRGEGKTKITERMLLKHTLQGTVSFAVLFAATGSNAQDSLDSIKLEIETNERLFADYPEVCAPVRALENTPNRAHYQLVRGTRHDNGKPFAGVASKFKWCGQEIILPRVPGSPSSGAIIATRGLDAAVRGLNKGNRRVDVACIDDPDTEETVNSEEQAEKLEKRIDRAIGGLGGQQRSIARMMLTTIQNRRCVSYRFTDPTQKPSWNGKRFRFLIAPPVRRELWEEYVATRQEDQQAGDEHGRRAHAFYLKNRKAMDAGAKVANPNRFNGEKLPDGSRVEVSALQRYFNEVARIGQEAVSSEYDNDPPEETGPVESGITAYRVQRQVSGYPRRIVPPDVKCLTHGVDVGKFALHFVVKAWRADATAYIIDYGVQEVLGTTRGSDEAVDKAIIRALYARRETVLTNPYTTADGVEVPIERTVVDAGYRTDAVYYFCREAGVGVYPAMGFGRSSGCVQARFHAPVRISSECRPGDGWFLSVRPKGVWLLCMDTDRWKSWEHDRWMTPRDQPGTCLLYGEVGIADRMSEDQKSHFSFSKHICAEVEIDDPVKGRGMVRKWKVKSDTNHYFDASYMADVAANMCGISLLKRTSQKPAMDKRPTLADLAARK